MNFPTYRRILGHSLPTSPAEESSLDKWYVRERRHLALLSFLVLGRSGAQIKKKGRRILFTCLPSCSRTGKQKPCFASIRGGTFPPAFQLVCSQRDGKRKGKKCNFGEVYLRSKGVPETYREKHKKCASRRYCDDSRFVFERGGYLNLPQCVS